jgi:hypothetical protein
VKGSSSVSEEMVEMDREGESVARRVERIGDVPGRSGDGRRCVVF